MCIRDSVLEGSTKCNNSAANTLIVQAGKHIIHQKCYYNYKDISWYLFYNFLFCSKNMHIKSIVSIFVCFYFSVKLYGCSSVAVSYTHLDVYKRQTLYTIDIMYILYHNTVTRVKEHSRRVETVLWHVSHLAKKGQCLSQGRTVRAL